MYVIKKRIMYGNFILFDNCNLPNKKKNENIVKIQQNIFGSNNTVFGFLTIKNGVTTYIKSAAQ